MDNIRTVLETNAVIKTRVGLSLLSDWITVTRRVCLKELLLPIKSVF